MLQLAPSRVCSVVTLSDGFVAAEPRPELTLSGDRMQA